MGRPRGPGKLYFARICKHAYDPRGNGEPGMVCSLEGVHAGASGGRTAGDCASRSFSGFRRQQLFYREQSSRGWWIYLLVRKTRRGSEDTEDGNSPPRHRVHRVFRQLTPRRFYPIRAPKLRVLCVLVVKPLLRALPLRSALFLFRAESRNPAAQFIH